MSEMYPGQVEYWQDICEKKDLEIDRLNNDHVRAMGIIKDQDAEIARLKHRLFILEDKVDLPRSEDIVEIARLNHANDLLMENYNKNETSAIQEIARLTTYIKILQDGYKSLKIEYPPMPKEGGGAMKMGKYFWFILGVVVGQLISWAILLLN